MAIKSVDIWASDVAGYGFDNIAKDNELRNCVSKALAAAHSKDQFDFLIDKGDPTKKYEKFIKKNNDLNISAALKKKCDAAAGDVKALKKLIDGEVKKEAELLFSTNLAGVLKKSPIFKMWVEQANRADVAAKAKTSAVKAAKLLGISDVENFTKAYVALATGEKALAAKLFKVIEKAEHQKNLEAMVQKNLAACGPCRLTIHRSNG